MARQARNEGDDVFDVQHLTSADIVQLEEALNSMDLEEMVSAVDQIVCHHLKTFNKHLRHTTISPFQYGVRR
jgi:hypothetical protein